MTLRPHHDGSNLYVSDAAPALLDVVQVRLRVPASWDPEYVGIRWLHDAEGQHTRATLLRSNETEAWWQADLLIRNPIAKYRWLLRGGNVGFGWVTATGWHDYDVADGEDFIISAYDTAPDWSKSTVVYQIFPDRFASSGARYEPAGWEIPREWDEIPEPRTPRTGQFYYGGDLPGVTGKLDHIEGLGIDTMYFTPVFPAGSAHRYDAKTYESIDPLLGGEEGLAQLTAAAHARGMRVIGDLTLNHCGITHEWFETALADDASAERGYFFFDSSTAHGYETWANARTLPKFDLRNDQLVGRLITDESSIVRTWMRAPYHLDGWRIDAANVMGRRRHIDVTHEIARQTRAAMALESDDFLLIAEHTQDASDDLSGDGWHGTMNYSGFTKPVWGWLRRDEDIMGMDKSVAHFTGVQMVKSITAYMGRMPWRSWCGTWNYLGSHDTARPLSVMGTRDRQIAGLGLLIGLPGTPMIFAGDEIGLEGDCDDLSRRTFPWDQPELWDYVTFDAYKQLVHLRRSSHALRDGGLRWVHVGNDVVGWLRESDQERLLFAVARSANQSFSLDATAWGLSSIETVYGSDVLHADGNVHVQMHDAGAGVWRLT